ncbi:hypothetical protein BKA65DRAFT_125319 [Rhexocercosporidium sp. MPI-PUGE-AT-0058]|nr:hypothetical protein BKA65DRAFT_125319 [Rhexocercosporidium sp. MPI-PUGE-AT-0058]
MRLPIVFSLLFLTTLVCADGLANGFERMWIYYAFLLDVKLASVNGGTRSILLNCASDAKFKDVMAAISTKDISHLTILSDEENRFPPIRETAKRLLDIGLTERYDSEEVIKGQRSFTRMISDLGWMVNNIKSQLTPEQLAPMKDASDRANESLMLAKSRRYFEVSNFMWGSLGKLPGIKVETSVGPWGEVIDWEKTKANSGLSEEEAKARVKKFKDDYYEGDPVAAGHRGPLRSMKKAYNMQGRISCGS